MALAVAIVEATKHPAPIAYSAFLDELEAGNVASVTFRGTEIDGQLKHGSESFRSRVPDFGDPALIAELRKQHVAVDVKSPSQWTSLFAHLPWPLLALLVVALIAGLMRLVRGPTAGPRSAVPMHPAGGMIGLLSSFFSQKRESGKSTEKDSTRSGEP